MSTKVQKNKKSRKSDNIDRSILIALFLILLLIISVDLISRNFHIGPLDFISSANNPELVQDP